MVLVLPLAPLFLSVVLLQLANGGMGPIDALSGLALGFSAEQVGLLGSAHFLGFFIGCWWAPRLIGAVGHSRAFAAFTALGVMGILGHVLVSDPWAWAGLRIASGLCVAGTYTVIEAWLQARASNARRGRTMGLYRLTDSGAQLAAQLLIGVLEPASYVTYTALALICCGAMLPITLSRTPPPATPGAPRLRPALALICSPLATMAVVVAAISGASFRMVGPVYGQEVGLSADRIALFLAAYVLGGALVQWPMGWLADRFDRRQVLIWLSVAAVGCSVLTAGLGAVPIGMVMLLAGLFGVTTFPIYSVAAAHAHDHARADERVELTAALMFFFALGAIAAPWLAALVIAVYGAGAMFWLIAVAHIVLLAFGLWRMRRRPAAEVRTRYVWTPRTSFTVGRLFKDARDEAHRISVPRHEDGAPEGAPPKP